LFEDKSRLSRTQEEEAERSEAEKELPCK
jgi:hypothetical protein